MIQTRQTLVGVLILLLLGCSADEFSSETSTEVESHVVIDKDTIRQNHSGALRGEGRFWFTEPLAGINSKEHYVLHGSFSSSEGDLVVHSHFTGFSENDGFNIKLVREEEHLHVFVSSPDYPYSQVCDIENAIGDDESFYLRIEVHDGVVAGSRFLIWSDRLSRQGERQRPLDVVTAELAHCDSARDNLVFYSNGQGPLWGLRIKGVTIRAAYREAPFVD